jgi:ligand-binding SRPBCC domain-containing protein
VRVFVLEREQWLPRPVDQVFAFFADAGNLETITPPWLRFRILSPGSIAMRPGTSISYRLRWHGLPIRWRTEIRSWDPPWEFSDVQAQGPYRLWHHSHRFAPANGGTLMRDEVRYALPFGALGRLVHAWLVKPDLEAIFNYRAARVAEILGAGPGVPGAAGGSIRGQNGG